jgi:hypothetical protein
MSDTTVTPIKSVLAPAESDLPPNPAGLPFASFAESYPMANEFEFEAIAESISRQGILVPIEVWRSPKGEWFKIDGRNRQKAAESVGYRWRPGDFKIFVGSEAEAIARADGLNAHRRHLTKEQKAARIKELIEKNPYASSRKLALMCGVSHSTVANIRREGKEESDKTFGALERAFTNATSHALDEFARHYRIDLEELLRGNRP